MEVDNGPACKTCAYSGEGYRLECRIKPPSPDYKNYGRMFPFVNPNDWCSKYRVKPELEPSKNTTSIIDRWMEED